ncbi:MAG: hypothetical protein ACOX68_05945 [Candidatus Limivicinus sp.]|jgi:hypothetical protein
MAEKKKGLFVAELLVYILLFAVLSIILLMHFNSQLEDYEAAGGTAAPDDPVAEWLEGIESGRLPEEFEPWLKKLDKGIKSPDENREFITQLFSDAVYYPAESADGSGLYVFEKDGVQFAGLSFKPQDGDSDEPPEAGSLELDLSPYINDYSCTLPSGWELTVNGRSIKPSDKAEYECLAPFYEYYPDLPMLMTYNSGKWLGDAEIVITDSEGRSGSPEEMNPEGSADFESCSDDVKQGIQAFINGFLPCYLNYSGDICGGGISHYYALEPYLCPSGILLARVNHYVGELGFGHAQYCNVISGDCNSIQSLGKGMYLADVTYTAETKGEAEPYTGENSFRLLISEKEGKYLAEELVYY